MLLQALIYVECLWIFAKLFADPCLNYFYPPHQQLSLILLLLSYLLDMIDVKLYKERQVAQAAGKLQLDCKLNESTYLNLV